MLRRFENFRIGALDAKRLNDMQDAIIDLYKRVERIPQRMEQDYGITLARIITRTGISQSECIPPDGARRINCAIYYFEEVLVRVDGTGSQPGSVDTCVSTKSYPGMLSSVNVTWGPDDPGIVPILLDLDATEYVYDAGDIVPCFRARIDDGRPSGELSKWRHLYVTRSQKSGAMARYVITQVMPTVGSYKAREYQNPNAFERPITNLYETQNYYGALQANVPCATLSPRALRVGDIVPVFQHNFGYITMAPTPFDVTCLPCNGQAPATPSSGAQAAKEAAAAGIMLTGEIA